MIAAIRSKLTVARCATHALCLIAVLGMAGCSQVGALKSKVSNAFSPKPAGSDGQASPAPDSDQPLSLSAITNTYLLQGRYVEGEQHLRTYLAKYPNDRAAQNMLRQLTADPKAMLGSASRSYVVQPGDSYSTLAARYLGDSNQFLALARYNGSTNPSTLRVGEVVRLPRMASRGAASNSTSTHGNAKETPTIVVTPATSQDASPSDESPAMKAQRLQAESTALLQQGKKDQALTRLDEALTVDPHVKPAGDPALRAQLLSSYHERAVVLYRDQKLDQAIALWDRILAVDPNYEPAVIYRARAIELQRRLNQI